MALNLTRTWLIAYDITCPKRLGRVHRYLKKHAIPVQYSVFTTQANDHGIRRIRDVLAAIINPKTDDVRMYPLPKVLEVHHVGRRSLPEGLHLLSDRQHRNSGLLTTTNILTEAAPEE